MPPTLPGDKPNHPPSIQKLLPAPAVKAPVKATEPEHNLPYSEDAEVAVLGSMIIDPEAAEIALGTLKTADFYLGKHRIIFALLAELCVTGAFIDEVYFCDELFRRKTLDQAGGRDYIGRLIVDTPSAAGIEEYSRIVREYAVQRELMDAAGQIMKLAAGKGSVEQASDIISAIQEKREPTASVYNWGHSVMVDTENDPNALLGHRWLSRGGSCLWVGSTGMGKSSLTAQCAAVWALGKPFFGITPKRPLRSLIIQAENDDGDISEIARGITNGLGLAKDIMQLSDSIHFASKTAVAGDAFMPYARKLIEKCRPDLLWIDPLFAFCGCDVSDQGAMSKFLRLGLQKLAQDTGVCNMVIHHTNKPKAALPNQTVTNEDAYSGSGTAEISNWARAVVRIKKLPAGDFELIAAKRGARAGLVDSKGKPVDSVFIKHAPRPDIYWVSAVEPEESEKFREKLDCDEIISKMVVGQLYSRAELRDLAQATLGIKQESYMRDTKRRPGRIFGMVEVATKDPTKMGFYIRNQ